MNEVLATILGIAGLLLFMASWLHFIVVGFKQNWMWGIALVCLPIYAIFIFTFKYRRHWEWLFVFLVGLLLISLAYMNLDSL